jgi:hypothetical protein
LADLAVGPTPLPASDLPAADLAVCRPCRRPDLAASQQLPSGRPCRRPDPAASQQPPSGRPCRRPDPAASQQFPSGQPCRRPDPAASQLPPRNSSTLHCEGFRFPLWVTCSTSVCRHRDWGLANQGCLGRRDNTRINAIPHETRYFRGPTDKDCGLFKEDTSVLGHWPQSRLDQSKDAAYKRPKKIKRAGNAQRKRKVHPLRALAVSLTALLARAGERTARALLQRKCRRARETQHADGVPFHTTNKTPTQPPFPPHSPTKAASGGGTTRELMQSHMRRGTFGAQRIKTAFYEIVRDRPP